MTTWILGAVALAGNVYINEVDVTGLQDQTFEDVTVSFDAEGNIHIDAPRYEIQVVEGERAERHAPDASVSRTPAAAASPPEGVLPEGRWWLVTEDEGSRGHEVQVHVNDAHVQTVRSGEDPLILDVGPWLEPGSNRIRMASHSTDAGGGTFYIYVGTGDNDSGTLVMDTPRVQFGLGPSRSGPYERTYSVTIQE